LRLLPSNGVLTVDAAGAPAPQLVALMQLLLLSRAQLQSLYAAVKQQLLEPTTADAGAAQQPPPAAGSGRGRQQGQKDRRPGPTSKSEPAAAQQQVAASAIQEVLGQVEAPLLQRALQHLCRLMVSRYTCSLEQDEALLQQLEQLPPRKAAAVVARAAEKRCWAAFGKVGGAQPCLLAGTLVAGCSHKVPSAATRKQLGLQCNKVWHRMAVTTLHACHASLCCRRHHLDSHCWLWTHQLRQWLAAKQHWHGIACCCCACCKVDV
jgi:hypothetical protein